MSQESSYCPNCGNKLSNQNHCIKCGYQLSLNTSLVSHDDSNHTIVETEQSSKRNKAIIFFILSIINLFIFLPGSVLFLFINFLLAIRFSSNLMLNLGFCVFSGYIVSSVTFFIVAIINFFKKGTIFKICFISIVISFFIGFMLPVLGYFFYKIVN